MQVVHMGDSSNHVCRKFYLTDAEWMFWLWVLSITAELEQEQEKQGEKITSERNALAEH